jgi:hypothetical protein
MANAHSLTKVGEDLLSPIILVDFLLLEVAAISIIKQGIFLELLLIDLREVMVLIDATIEELVEFSRFRALCKQVIILILVR